MIYPLNAPQVHYNGSWRPFLLPIALLISQFTAKRIHTWFRCWLNIFQRVRLLLPFLVSSLTKKIGRRPKVVDFVCMKIKGDPRDFTEVSFCRRFSVSLVFPPLSFLDWLPVKQKVTLRVGLFAKFPGQHLRRTLSSVFDSKGPNRFDDCDDYPVMKHRGLSNHYFLTYWPVRNEKNSPSRWTFHKFRLPTSLKIWNVFFIAEDGCSAVETFRGILFIFGF